MKILLKEPEGIKFDCRGKHFTWNLLKLCGRIAYNCGVEDTLAQMVDVSLEVMLAGWHRHCYSLPHPSKSPPFTLSLIHI